MEHIEQSICKRCNGKFIKKKTKNEKEYVLVCSNYPDCKALIYI
ncbi:MAG: topoisomerase DNA-binding C4 zinc finger domain-containing protein [Candidatus Magnetomorum sp.]|nr:topoisomerase DNA-binding C4 zinc finger domain-containing protein [Candidatus Magnetomorum sp.]